MTRPLFWLLLTQYRIHRFEREVFIKDHVDFILNTTEWRLKYRRRWYKTILPKSSSHVGLKYFKSWWSQRKIRIGFSFPLISIPAFVFQCQRANNFVGRSPTCSRRKLLLQQSGVLLYALLVLLAACSLQAAMILLLACSCFCDCECQSFSSPSRFSKTPFSRLRILLHLRCALSSFSQAQWGMIAFTTG